MAAEKSTCFEPSCSERRQPISHHRNCVNARIGIRFTGGRARRPNPSLDDDPSQRLLVGRENDPRAGHGVRKGFVVVESNAKLSADIGQLGWTDVPGAPGHLDSASKRQ